VLEISLEINNVPTSQVAHVLVEAGHDPDPRNYRGVSPLWEACDFGNRSIVAYLLRLNAREAKGREMGAAEMWAGKNWMVSRTTLS
jgi:ankyrin repeat protein